MIGYLRGTVAASGRVVIDGSGVGWQVQSAVPLVDGSVVDLHITTVVREDAITLYAFEDDDQRRCFDALTKVSGIGPGIALTILRALTPGELVAAVEAKDVTAFSRVKGVGAKAAEKIITMIKLPTDVAGVAVDELVGALEALGYDSIEAKVALAQARATTDTDEDALKAALAMLSGGA